MSGFDSIYAVFLRMVDGMLGDQTSQILQATLAFVYLVSGTYKMRQPLAAATSAANFRVPVRPTKAVGLTIALGELSLAAILLMPVRGLALVALGVSTALSLLFTVLTVGVLRRGESFDCSCLGKEPVSKLSAVRAGALFVASLLAWANVAWNGTRTITAESQLSAIGMALTIVFLPYTIRLAFRVRSLVRDFGERVDWMWISMELGARKGG
ncbi:hypothetical protein LG324_04265 [Phycicoccus jejuensis]|uniref:MauE/DoxX family redox-associated membrane protein n=1 Tax=Phycicoccus jejuensis TaxID=367299 RepID=UPI0038515A81